MNNLNLKPGAGFNGFAHSSNGLSTITTATGLLNQGSSTTTGVSISSALLNNGTCNTAIGYHTLGSITTGTNNIAIGYSALSGYSTELLEFYDMMLEALGYDDKKREDFLKMSKEERKAILREVKINRVLNK